MRFLAISALLGLLASLGGCASTTERQDPDRVSTIPWNRPEKGEGDSPFGGLMQGN
jgi:hypothetical protein